MVRLQGACRTAKERGETMTCHLDPVGRILAGLWVAFAVLAGQTAWAAPSAIVDTAYVVEAVQRHAIVWDVRSSAAYRQGHIQGAVNIDDIRQTLRDANTEAFLPVAELARRLGAAGIDPSREIIVYGAKANPVAYLGLVLLQYLDAANVRVYHGGLDDWKDAKQPVAAEATQLAPVVLQLHVRPDILVDTAEVVGRLSDPSVQIVDARRPTEYDGEEIHALRGGHIPGAIPIYFMQNCADPEAQKKLDNRQISSTEGLNLKSPRELKALYAELDPNKETIVYCQGGSRSSESATILKSLGFAKVRVYQSSWLGYGNTLDAPVEHPTFLNIGQLQDRVKDLERRLDQLEKASSGAP